MIAESAVRRMRASDFVVNISFLLSGAFVCLVLAMYASHGARSHDRSTSFTSVLQYFHKLSSNFRLRKLLVSIRNLACM